MAADKRAYLKVNEPHVVHETIEGEAILLNLGTGNYYSIEWPGTMVWDLLNESGDVQGIKRALINADEADKNNVEKTFQTFINSLLEEELVVPDADQDHDNIEMNSEREKEFKKAVLRIDKLTLNKYTDMRDMLLLDPIHDVDEKGWPEPKKDSKKEE